MRRSSISWSRVTASFVLLKPRLERQTLLLWLLTPFVLAAGALALWINSRRRKALAAADPSPGPIDGEEETRIKQLMSANPPQIGRFKTRRIFKNRADLRRRNRCRTNSRAWFGSSRKGPKTFTFCPAINCRIYLTFYYKSLIPSPERRKAAAPIFSSA